MIRDLPQIRHDHRLDRLRASMQNLAVDSFLTSDHISLRWLSGFTGSAGRLLVSDSTTYLLTDGRYAEQAEKQMQGTGIEIVIGGPSEQMALIDRHVDGLQKLALEADRVSWLEAEELRESLRPDVVSTPGIISDLRRIKEPAEVARIEAAASIADRALKHLQPDLANKPTEIEFARALDYAMLNAGAEGLSFDTICASGPNGALPHAKPSDRVISPGDLVVLDFGALVDGYHSDMTRTFTIGDADEQSWVMLKGVTDAQELGYQSLQPGVVASEVDAVCRSHLAELGLAEYFVHGTGHGVGLEIHEAPWINSRSATTLQEGQVVTVEPGVYRPGLGGVRVEDTVLIAASGPRRLTSAPKDPIV